MVNIGVNSTHDLLLYPNNQRSKPSPLYGGYLIGTSNHNGERITDFL
jgi:hypothetical protein